MKLLIISPNQGGDKFCIIGISFDDITIGIVIDTDWSN